MEIPSNETALLTIAGKTSVTDIHTAPSIFTMETSFGEMRNAPYKK